MYIFFRSGFLLISMALMMTSYPANAQVVPPDAGEPLPPESPRTPRTDSLLPGAESNDAQDTTTGPDSASSLPTATPPTIEVEVPKPKQRFRTGIRGRVIDKKSGEPLIEAAVELLNYDKRTVRTDVEGRFEIPLPPGVYKLRVYYPLYTSRRLRNVIVRRGKVRRLSVRLVPAEDAVQTVIIYAEPERQTEVGLLQERKRSTTVSDAISAEEISRSGDSAASDAIKRVVSATVVDGRYVFVRGLGDRYVTALLNNVVLPSPEPDRQAVPLDLFPTSLLSSMQVAKSYSATAPGTFGGGTLSIETNKFPDDFTLKVKASMSGNTTSTFKTQNSYKGGGLDFLGFDDGARSLPKSIPRDRIVDAGATVNAAEAEAMGESLANNWSLTDRTSLPNFGAGVLVGDTVKLAGKKFGYLASLNYGHKLAAREASVAKIQLNGEGNAEFREQVENTRGTQSAKIGGLLTIGYALGKHHDVNLVSLYSHSGESTAIRQLGRSAASNQNLDKVQLRFLERQLSFTQLQTKHHFPGLWDSRLTWQGNFSLTSRDEPDRRDVLFEILGGGERRAGIETGSNDRYFANLTEYSYGTGADLELIPHRRINLKTGGSIQRSTRDFASRRFWYRFVGSDPSVLFGEPETIYSPDNIGTAFQFDELTRDTDAYEASLLVAGVYVASDVEITSNVRTHVGVRLEASEQEVTSGGSVLDSSAGGASQSSADILPGVSVTYAPTKTMNVRGAYGFTLARPRFRELAPFIFVDSIRRRNVTGNPDLIPTRIHNADLRWEWFGGGGSTDLVSTSVFYKKFLNPIEAIVVSSQNGDLSFANAASADTVGVELEARIGLERFHRALHGFRAWGNVTLARSTVELRPEQVTVQTSVERSLAGQSPYVVNLGINYEHAPSSFESSILYNVHGRRLTEVGFNFFPDVFEQPFHRLDVNAKKKFADDLVLKLAGKNLLNQTFKETQGGLNVFSYKPGVEFSLSVEWKH